MESIPMVKIISLTSSRPSSAFLLYTLCRKPLRHWQLKDRCSKSQFNLSRSKSKKDSKLLENINVYEIRLHNSVNSLCVQNLTSRRTFFKTLCLSKGPSKNYVTLISAIFDPPSLLCNEGRQVVKRNRKKGSFFYECYSKFVPTIRVF